MQNIITLNTKQIIKIIDNLHEQILLPIQPFIFLTTYPLCSGWRLAQLSQCERQDRSSLQGQHSEKGNHPVQHPHWHQIKKLESPVNHIPSRACGLCEETSCCMVTVLKTTSLCFPSYSILFYSILKLQWHLLVIRLTALVVVTQSSVDVDVDI